MKKDDEFRQAVRDVRPLAVKPRAARRDPPPSPEPRQFRLDERAALAESLAGSIDADDSLEAGEELAYLGAGVSREVLRRLRRGHWVVQANLDLHGMNRVEAAAAIAEFLADCAERSLRCVRIVHGKGLGSPNREPVLKAKLRKWLPQRREVLAFCQAPPVHGGGGAALVLLGSRR